MKIIYYEEALFKIKEVTPNKCFAKVKCIHVFSKKSPYTKGIVLEALNLKHKDLVFIEI
jgi:hypothetical protein